MNIPGFKINGKAVSNTPRLVTAAVALLKKLPNGELLTADEFVSRLGISKRHWQSGTCYTSRPEIAPHKALIRYPHKQTVYGNRKTIAKLLKQKDLLA